MQYKGWVKVSRTHLAHGLIFSARPRLTQNPAPPVANQKLTGFCEDTKKKQSNRITGQIFKK